MQTVHLLIKGKVQRVFYRASAKDMAIQLGVTGWVKNTPNGDVEIIATGDEPSIEKFVEWCRQGPKQAEVREVVLSETNPTQFFHFSIIR